MNFILKHDIYISGIHKLFNTSGLFKQPPFGSALIIELRKDKQSGNYYIKVLSKDNIYPEPDQLNPVKIYGKLIKI